jgi:hypothetical protein
VRNRRTRAWRWQWGQHERRTNVQNTQAQSGIPGRSGTMGMQRLLGYTFVRVVLGEGGPGIGVLSTVPRRQPLLQTETHTYILASSACVGQSLPTIQMEDCTSMHRCCLVYTRQRETHQIAELRVGTPSQQQPHHIVVSLLYRQM